MSFIPRLIPVSIFDITQVEAYFTHMASKGYFVKKMRGNFATFEKGTPQKMKYRLDPFNDKTKEPPQEMLFLYDEQGWEYVCKFNFFHLYKSTRADAAEIHTDPVVQGETFDKISRDLRDFFLFSAILLLISGSFFYSTFYKYPVYSMIKFGSKIASITAILMYILYFCQTLRNYRKIKKTKQQLEAGLGMIHNETYKPSYRHSLFLAFPFILLFIMFAISHYGSSVDWEKRLSQYNGELPTISITELENHPNLSTVYADDSLGPYENYISYHWSELAPQAYYIEQQGKDISGTYLPSTQTEFYRMRFQFLAEPLFDEILDSKTDSPYFTKIEYNELLDTKFDQALLVTTETPQMFFGRIGEKVIFIRYFGDKKLESVVDQIYDAVNDFSVTH